MGGVILANSLASCAGGIVANMRFARTTTVRGSLGERIPTIFPKRCSVISLTKDPRLPGTMTPSSAVQTYRGYDGASSGRSHLADSEKVYPSMRLMERKPVARRMSNFSVVSIWKEDGTSGTHTSSNRILKNWRLSMRHRQLCCR